MSGIRVVAVVGPTAAGKSEVSLDLAEALSARGRSAEVINADSMQLYRGMDIGTAKLPAGERRGVPHHLLDVWDVTRQASVAEYQALARARIAETAARGNIALLVGGSGLYVDAVLDDLRFPGTDPVVRAGLEAELAERGPRALHDRLARLDPAAAGAILPSNGRRIVRALEVIEMSGRPFRATLPPPSERVPYHPAARIGLDVALPALDARIAARVDRMWDAGLVAEVRGLTRAGLAEAPTASRALGYAQVLAHLAGQCTEEQARADTVLATRRFARRQRSWFRRDPRVVWLDAGAPDLLDRALVAALMTATGAAGAPSRR